MNNVYVMHIQIGAVGGAYVEDCKEEAAKLAVSQGQKVILKHNGKSYEFYGREAAEPIASSGQ